MLKAMLKDMFDYPNRSCLAQYGTKLQKSASSIGEDLTNSSHLPSSVLKDCQEGSFLQPLVLRHVQNC